MPGLFLDDHQTRVAPAAEDATDRCGIQCAAIEELDGFELPLAGDCLGHCRRLVDHDDHFELGIVQIEQIANRSIDLQGGSGRDDDADWNCQAGRSEGLGGLRRVLVSPARMDRGDDREDAECTQIPEREHQRADDEELQDEHVRRLPRVRDPSSRAACAPAGQRSVPLARPATRSGERCRRR